MTMGAVLATSRVAMGVSGPDGSTPLMHGPTFMGNPLAASVAIASLSLLQERNWRQDVSRIEAVMRERLSLAKSFPGVKDVRVLGAIGVVELSEAPAPKQSDAIQAALVSAGVWVRPFGELLYVMPSYIMTHEQVAFLCVVGRYTAGEVGFSESEIADIFAAETFVGSAGRLRGAP